MVLFKVGVSCYAAVLSDAKLKGFSSMSMSAKLSLMSMARVIASVAIAAVMEPEMQPSYKLSAGGFFEGWTLGHLDRHHLFYFEESHYVVPLEVFGRHPEECGRGAGGDRDLPGSDRCRQLHLRPLRLPLGPSGGDPRAHLWLGRQGEGEGARRTYSSGLGRQGHQQQLPGLREISPLP